MDRRQRKTRDAIFKAFIALLSEKNYNQITVAEVICRADVGRATFYAHFETKDYLLKELCRELFGHVFSAEDSRLFYCDAHDDTFEHLFQHLYKNDNQILELLSCRNNELFLHYFRSSLTAFLRENPELFSGRENPGLPEDFWVEHIASTFVETVRWWLAKGRLQSPEELAKYFLMAV